MKTTNMEELPLLIIIIALVIAGVICVRDWIVK